MLCLASHHIFIQAMGVISFVYLVLIHVFFIFRRSNHCLAELTGTYLPLITAPPVGTAPPANTSESDTSDSETAFIVLKRNISANTLDSEKTEQDADTWQSGICGSLWRFIVPLLPLLYKQVTPTKCELLLWENVPQAICSIIFLLAEGGSHFVICWSPSVKWWPPWSCLDPSAKPWVLTSARSWTAPWTSGTTSKHDISWKRCLGFTFFGDLSQVLIEFRIFRFVFEPSCLLTVQVYKSRSNINRGKRIILILSTTPSSTLRNPWVHKDHWGHDDSMRTLVKPPNWPPNFPLQADFRNDLDLFRAALPHLKSVVGELQKDHGGKPGRGEQRFVCLSMHWNVKGDCVMDDGWCLVGKALCFVPTAKRAFSG